MDIDSYWKRAIITVEWNDSRGTKGRRHSSSPGDAPMRSPVSSRSGFHVIELMVAMVLALLILAAIGGLYVSTKQTFRVQDNTSGIDEVLRAIEEDMSREIRKAGYFGCFRVEACN